MSYIQFLGVLTDLDFSVNALRDFLNVSTPATL